MNCPRCGTPNPEHASSCSVCATPLATNVTARIISPHDSLSQPLAGWWRRVGATFADNLILIIPTLVVGSIFEGLGNVYTGAVAGLLLQGFYMVWLIGSKSGQTVGNRIAASRVVDALTGSQVTFGQSLKRWGFVAIYSSLEFTGANSATLIVSLIGLVDVLWPLVDPRNQTLHDKFARTLVVLA